MGGVETRRDENEMTRNEILRFQSFCRARSFMLELSKGRRDSSIGEKPEERNGIRGTAMHSMAARIHRLPLGYFHSLSCCIPQSESQNLSPARALSSTNAGRRFSTFYVRALLFPSLNLMRSSSRAMPCHATPLHFFHYIPCRANS